MATKLCVLSTAASGMAEIWQLGGNILEWETTFTVRWESLGRKQVQGNSMTKAQKHKRQK